MAKYSQQLLEEQYLKLPPILKDAFLDVNLAEKMSAISQKHKLTVEEAGFVAEEAGYVILGLTKPAELSRVLADRLEMGEEEAREITQDISREIFFPLRESLKKAHQMEVEEPEVIKPEAVPMASSAPSAKPAPAPPQPPIRPPGPPIPEILKEPELPPPPAKAAPEPILKTAPEIPKKGLKTEPLRPSPKPETMPGGSIFAMPRLVPKVEPVKPAPPPKETQTPPPPSPIRSVPKVSETSPPPRKQDLYREPAE